MVREDKITIDIFKVVAKAVAESDNLPIMLDHLAQLLVAALEIKGCSIFVLDQERGELEPIASFGLSTAYQRKGTISANQSIGCTLRGESVIIRDLAGSDRLQYPDAARKEGIAAIVSLPIFFLQKVIGVLRLYHHEVWDISDKDMDSLLILGESIGMAMMFTRLLNSLQVIKSAAEDLPPELDRFM
ncbi:MAG: GAF domain-containing protein [Desulfatiglandaceae bacterium]